MCRCHLIAINRIETKEDLGKRKNEATRVIRANYGARYASARLLLIQIRIQTHTVMMLVRLLLPLMDAVRSKKNVFH